MKIIRSAFSAQDLLNLKKLLLDRAEKRHGRIIPCGSWDSCFTMEDDTLFFWYTTPHDQSTHLVSQDLKDDR
jgi:hypothetical protein